MVKFMDWMAKFIYCCRFLHSFIGNFNRCFRSKPPIGLWITFVKFFINTSILNLKYLVAYYNAFILLPYALIVFYWLGMKRKVRPSDWYDEKQFRDISKAGLLTLLMSLPVIGVLYVMNIVAQDSPASVLWFPFYVHFVLVFFSGSVLYLRGR